MESEPPSPLTPPVPIPTLPVNVGVGFLQFAQHQHALAAIAAMDGQVVVGDSDADSQQPQQQQQHEQAIKPLVVKFATPKAANPNGPATPKASHNKPSSRTQSPRTPRKHLTIPSSPTASNASSTTTASSSSASSTASSASSADHNLYVAGFPLAYAREDVSRLLTPFGPLASLRLLPPASPGGERGKGERRGGVAFARFVCIEDGDRCIAAMDGQSIEGGGRGLQVRYANRGGRMSAHQASAVLGLDGSAMSALEYNAYSAALYGVPSSPYASFDYSGQLLSPNYGFSAASDMLSPSYSSYPYTVVDPYTGSSYYYTVNAAAPSIAATASTPVGLASPATYTAFSFPSPTTASVPYPTTPTTPTSTLSSRTHHQHPADTANHSPPLSSLSSHNGTTNSSLFPSHLSLFLCHLPLHWSEANLLSLCNPYGHLTSARIVRDRDGGSRGYGFVAFDRVDEAARAREALDGRKVDGRLVKVQWKDGRTSRTGSAMGGGAGAGVDALGAGVDGGVYGGLLSPTAGGMLGLAVMA